jgi:opacity protein-like surface antigen
MKKLLLSTILLFTFSVSFAQDSPNTPQQPTTTVAPSSTPPSTTEVKESKPFPLPVISFGYGLINFSGDVGYSGVNEPLTARSGFQAEIQHHTNNGLAFSLFYTNANLLGEEKNASRALNFKTKLQSGGLMIRYDFLSKKSNNQVIVPFITAGIEYMTFDVYTDLKDANGVYYNYWSDGTIRDIPQSDPNADQATLLHRDYKYETQLPQQDNLAQYDDFKTSTWGVPVGAGVRLKLSDQISLHLSSVYHFTGTDYLDAISSNGSGPYKGDSRKDGFLFSSVALRFDLYKSHDDANWKTIMSEDADKDGILDVVDDSSGTPLNNVVDANGKPLDTDDDGIPDYRDKEANSAKDAVVNQDGETITEEMIEEAFKRDSLAALPAIIEYIKSYDKLTERKPEVEQKFIQDRQQAAQNAPHDSSASSVNSATGILPESKVPTLYRQLDGDGNGILTPKEMGIAIDAYLAKKSPYSVSEFFDLIDFFFSQK